jgi:transposase
MHLRDADELDRLVSQGGLSELVRPIRHQKPSRLSAEQQAQLKTMVLTQRPTDYGIERQMWTGAILSEVILRALRCR